MWAQAARPMDSMTAQPSDEKLMMQYKNGSLRAFEALYARHKGGLFRFILRSVGSVENTEELFQEVWGKMIAGADRYEPKAKFTTYLYRIARNAIIDQYRKGSGLSVIQDTETVEQTAASQGQPDREYANDVLGTQLEEAVGALPVEQRTAFLLQVQQGMKLDDIAAICGVGRETIKSRLRYASSKLRENLEVARV